MENKTYTRVADLYPLNELTLLHGLAGSGKSYSCIKSLNEHQVVPIHINLDETAGLDELKTINVGYDFLKNINKITDLKDEVIIIDTYTRLVQNLGKLKETKISEYLESLTKFGTIIVIGHTSDFVGRADIFRDNRTLVNNSAEVMWLENTKYKATKIQSAYIDYNLHIIKGRGYSGSKIIENWMRE